MDDGQLVWLLIRHGDSYLLDRIACRGEEPHASKVTVLVPCYLKARWVIETVKSALRQSRRPDAVRVFLMDAESKKLRGELEALSPLVSCEERGRLPLSDARNRLAESCVTEFMTLLDADDLLAPNFFETMLSRDADFTLSRSVIMSDGRKMLGVRRNLLGGNLTGVFRTEAFLALGGLDPRFNRLTLGDTDFLLTALESGRTVRIEQRTRYFLRRDSGDWQKSSVTKSPEYIMRRRESYRLVLSKHRGFWERLLEHAIQKDEGDQDTCLTDALSQLRQAT